MSVIHSLNAFDFILGMFLVLRAKHCFCSRYRQHLAITESHDTEVRATHKAWLCVQVFW